MAMISAVEIDRVDGSIISEWPGGYEPIEPRGV
jgi:hypothetical protein